MWIIGYEYESALGQKLKKVVVCESIEEYKRILERIEYAERKTDVKRIEFDEVLNSKEIL